ncbi:MAG: hypothetical protein ABIC82_05745 [bacterium]
MLIFEKEGLSNLFNKGKIKEREEQEREKQERENKEREEQEKKNCDPIRKFFQKIGLDPKEFNFSYKTVAEIKSDPEEEGYVLGTFKEFNNYHDLRDFRNKLSEEQKEKMDGQKWEDGWRKIAIFASTDFWDKLNDPSDELHKHKDELNELRDKIRNEKIEDEYARRKEEEAQGKERNSKETNNEQDAGNKEAPSELNEPTAESVKKNVKYPFSRQLVPPQWAEKSDLLSLLN